MAEANQSLEGYFGYGDISGLDASFRNLPGELQIKEVQEIGDSFVKNANRGLALWALPLDAAYMGSVIGQIQRAAMHGMYGIAGPDEQADSKLFVTVGPDLQPNPIADRVDRLMNVASLPPEDQQKIHVLVSHIWQRWYQEFAGKSLQEHRRIEHAIGAMYLAFISPNPNVSMGLQAGLASVSLSIWTAFETMAGDLWESALNLQPTTLARLDGKVDRSFTKKQSALTKADESLRALSSVPDTKSQEKSIKVRYLQEHGYDLSKVMGTVHRERFNFQKLESIQEAYQLAFATDNTDVYNAISNEALRSLAEVRNVLLHNAGVVDQQFKNRTEGNSLLGQFELGKPLNLTGSLVIKLINPVLKCSADLMKAVDAWLAKHNSPSH